MMVPQGLGVDLAWVWSTGTRHRTAGLGLVEGDWIYALNCRARLQPGHCVPETGKRGGPNCWV